MNVWRPTFNSGTIRLPSAGTLARTLRGRALPASAMGSLAHRSTRTGVSLNTGKRYKELSPTAIQIDAIPGRPTPTSLRGFHKGPHNSACTRWCGLSVIKAHAVGIKAPQIGAQQWAGVPTSGAGPGDLKSNCDRCVHGAVSFMHVIQERRGCVPRTSTRRPADGPTPLSSAHRAALMCGQDRARPAWPQGAR